MFSFSLLKKQVPNRSEFSNQHSGPGRAKANFAGDFIRLGHAPFLLLRLDQHVMATFLKQAS